MAWVEGFTSSNEILKTIARNLCTLYRDNSGNIMPDKNWQLVYPNPVKHRSVRRVTQEVLESIDYQMYKLANGPVVRESGITVFRDGALVASGEYSFDAAAGQVLFKTYQRKVESVIDEALTLGANNIDLQLAHGDILVNTLNVYRNDQLVEPIEYIVDGETGLIRFRALQNASDVFKASYDYLGDPYAITADYTYFSDIKSVTGEALVTSDGLAFAARNGNFVYDQEPTVYSNGTFVTPTEYTVDRRNGIITFSVSQSNVAYASSEDLASTDYITFSTTHKPITFEAQVNVYRDGNLVNPADYTLNRTNGTITFNTIQRRTVSIVQEVMTTQDYLTYKTSYTPLVPGSVVVYRNSSVVSSSEYLVNYQQGTVTFNAAQNASDQITVDYRYYGTPYRITADYAYYKNIVTLQNVTLQTTNYIIYSTGQQNVLAQSMTVKRNDTAVDPSEYTVDAQNGLIIFNTAQSASDVIKASFSFCPRINYITADYSYYGTIINVTNETLTPVNNQVYNTTHDNLIAEYGVVVYKNGAVVNSDQYTVDYAFGMIVMNQPVESTDQLTVDYNYYTDGLEEAIAATKERLVVKTTTTPVQLTEEQILQNLYQDERLNVTSITMYVEFYKPERLVNPELGMEYYKDADGMYIRTDLNHHYVNVRMFDSWDPVTEMPTPSVYDTSGRLLVRGAAVSPWSKFAWFRDWEEAPVSFVNRNLNDDSKIASGSLLVQTKVPFGLDEIPIRHFVSVNNDRAIITLMGEPSIDPNNYLLSMAYIGRIKPHEDSVNDTFGNFAITVSSSTIPCRIGKAPAGKPEITSCVASPSGGSLGFNMYGYAVTFVTAEGESKPSDIKYVTTQNNNNTSSIKLTVNIPDGALAYKIYRCSIYPYDYNSLAFVNTISNYRLIAIISDPSATEFIDDGSYVVINESPPPNGAPVQGVRRDPKTGVVLQVNYPDNFGQGTANGVTDICMYRTRGGAYYQQHRVEYHAHEETMTKVGFNPSNYTGKIHVSCISVVHPLFDGQRGTLDDMVAVNATGLAPIDELVMNKGKPNEEMYKFFAINAPYSFLTAGPNSFYGVAVKKA